VERVFLTFYCCPLALLFFQTSSLLLVFLRSVSVSQAPWASQVPAIVFFRNAFSPYPLFFKLSFCFAALFTPPLWHLLRRSFRLSAFQRPAPRCSPPSPSVSFFPRNGRLILRAMSALPSQNRGPAQPRLV